MNVSSFVQCDIRWKDKTMYPLLWLWPLPREWNRELFFWTWFSVLPHAVIHLSARISARGNSHFRVYFRHVEIPEKLCIPACFPPRKFTNPLVNWHAEIHFPARISASGNAPKNEYFRTLGNPQFLVYFHMRKCTIYDVNFHMGKSVFPPARIYTYFCVFPHAVIHLKMCKSASAEIHFSSCGNSH